MKITIGKVSLVKANIKVVDQPLMKIVESLNDKSSQIIFIHNK